MKRLFALVPLLCTIGCDHKAPYRPDMVVLPDMVIPEGLDGFFAPTTTLGELMPTVTNQNPIGGTIGTPTVVAVTWDDDTNRADAEAFYPNFAQSKAWTDQTAEYGIGKLTVGTPQHLTGNAPATFSDGELQTLLKTNLGGTSPVWGKADSNTTYELFVPAATMFDDGTGGMCCAGYAGYHGDVIVDGTDVTYAVICECVDGANTLEDITVTCGHELVETVTDPFYGTPGYEWPSDQYFAWVLVTSGELADLCEFADTANWKPSDMTYYVQRTWSNKAAMAGHDPCVGDGTTPYATTIPYMADYLSDGFGDKDILGIQIAVGATATIGLKVFADAATGPLAVTLEDVSEMFGGQTLLRFTQPTMTVMPGQVLGVPVTVLQQDRQSFGTTQPFQVTTQPMSGGPKVYYYGTIGQTAGTPPTPSP